VADDDPFFRKLIASALRTRFVVSAAVENGRQVVDSAGARRPAVIVSDVNMPVLGGVGAMHALRELGQSIPFVMVSADPENARTCLEQGAAAFVHKRDVARELVAAVLAALSGQTYVSAGAADDPARPYGPRHIAGEAVG
jgi:CheY-like chemotaxis protein